MGFSNPSSFLQLEGPGVLNLKAQPEDTIKFGIELRSFVLLKHLVLSQFPFQSHYENGKSEATFDILP